MSGLRQGTGAGLQKTGTAGASERGNAAAPGSGTGPASRAAARPSRPAATGGKERGTREAHAANLQADAPQLLHSHPLPSAHTCLVIVRVRQRGQLVPGLPPAGRRGRVEKVEQQLLVCGRAGRRRTAGGQPLVSLGKQQDDALLTAQPSLLPPQPPHARQPLPGVTRAPWLTRQPSSSA